MGSSDPGTGRERDEQAGQPTDAIPTRPEDTTAGGDAKNDSGEDNQRQKGERPADDYVRR